MADDFEIKPIEDLVHNSKELKTVLRDRAKSKLLSYGLIEREKVNGVYPLTPRGRHFESFAKEDEAEKRELYMKRNAYLRAKYW